MLFLLKQRTRHKWLASSHSFVYSGCAGRHIKVLFFFFPFSNTEPSMSIISIYRFIEDVDYSVQLVIMLI